jgi:hypothetical protein
MTKNSDWDLAGKKVSGFYLGTIFVSGTVNSSRVKLGGSVIHYLQLDKPKSIHGSVRDVVSLYDEELTSHCYRGA